MPHDVTSSSAAPLFWLPLLADQSRKFRDEGERKGLAARELQVHRGERGSLLESNSLNNSIEFEFESILLIFRRGVPIFGPHQASYSSTTSGRWSGMVLKSVLRPSRFGFGNKQVACESSLNSSDNAKDADTSCVASSHKEHGEKDAGDYNGSQSHAGRGGDDVTLKRKPSSSRRVRGLWNERDSCSYFAQLQVEIISDGVFSFLTLEERVMSAMTCRRFAYCSQQPGCWAGVDATSYVERLYHAHLARASNELAKRRGCGISSTTSRSNKSPEQLAKEQTSAALVALITVHKNDIERLVVRNIDHRLSSDVAAMGIGACLAVGRLHENRTNRLSRADRFKYQRHVSVQILW